MTTPCLTLQELRLTLQWSQHELAKASQLSVGTIINLEHRRNSPTAKTVRRVARGLGVAPALVWEALRHAP